MIDGGSVQLRWHEAPCLCGTALSRPGWQTGWPIWLSLNPPIDCGLGGEFSLCGSGWGESVVECPTSVSGCPTGSFVSGVVWCLLLADDRDVSMEHAVEQHVPRGFPRPVGR